MMLSEPADEVRLSAPVSIAGDDNVEAHGQDAFRGLPGLLDDRVVGRDPGPHLFLVPLVRLRRARVRECGEVLVPDGVNSPSVESRRRERRRGGVRDRYDAVKVERGSAHFVNHPLGRGP